MKQKPTTDRIERTCRQLTVFGDFTTLLSKIEKEDKCGNQIIENSL